jgi:hypothetical protein
LASAIEANGGRAILFVKPETVFPLVVNRMPEALKSCTVVIPSVNRISPDVALALRVLMGHEGLPDNVRDAFKLEEGIFHGTISGRTFRFCSLPDLAVQSESAAVLTETAFLPVLFENEIKTPILQETKRFFLSLKDRKVVKGEILWLDDSSRPDYPFEFSFLFQLFREMAYKPDDFMDKMPEKWEVLADAEYFRFFTQNEQAYAKYREYLDMEPGDPSACLKIAYMAAIEREPEVVVTWVERAVALNRDYASVYPALERYFIDKGMREAADLIRKAMKKASEAQ